MARRPRPPCVPCERNEDLAALIDQFAEVLRTQSHTLGAHGLSEKDFYQGGLFRGAVERVRGQHIAATGEKREFVQRVLNHLQDEGFIVDWESASGANRYDYLVKLAGDRTAAVALKGCLDGNNTNIFERPAGVDEFVLWSLCTNQGADPRLNVWSGIHTRLGTEIVSRQERVDGLVVWDWLCGTVGRPCPKVAAGAPLTQVGPYQLPPPCIYVFPAITPNRSATSAPSQTITDVRLLDAFHRAFGGSDAWLHTVDFEVEPIGTEIARTTTIRRGGIVVQKNDRPSPIQRT